MKRGRLAGVALTLLSGGTACAQSLPQTLADRPESQHAQPPQESSYRARFLCGSEEIVVDLSQTFDGRNGAARVTELTTSLGALPESDRQQVNDVLGDFQTVFSVTAECWTTSVGVRFGGRDRVGQDKSALAWISAGRLSRIGP